MGRDVAGVVVACPQAPARSARTRTVTATRVLGRSDMCASLVVHDGGAALGQAFRAATAATTSIRRETTISVWSIIRASWMMSRQPLTTRSPVRPIPLDRRCSTTAGGVRVHAVTARDPQRDHRAPVVRSVAQIQAIVAWVHMELGIDIFLVRAALGREDPARVHPAAGEGRGHDNGEGRPRLSRTLRILHVPEIHAVD